MGSLIISSMLSCRAAYSPPLPLVTDSLGIHSGTWACPSGGDVTCASQPPPLPGLSASVLFLTSMGAVHAWPETAVGENETEPKKEMEEMEAGGRVSWDEVRE